MIMVNLTTNKLRLIARKTGMKDYQNMSEKRLLSTLDKTDQIFENLLQNGLEEIIKMQNLSQNDLKQITRMNNLLQHKLQ